MQSARCAVGLAIYEPDPDSITQYTEPSKPKQYMACGLPVIISRVPWIAAKIEENTMGTVVDYSEAELADAIIKLLSGNEFCANCRKTVIELASELGWETVSDEALSEWCD